MRAARRRRTSDPLASPATVRRICQRLRDRLPALILPSEKKLRRFLVTLGHVERRPLADPQRGRPSRFRREDLLQTGGALCCVLGRETGGRVSLFSFVGQYLPALDFPSDVMQALTS